MIDMRLHFIYNFDMIVHNKSREMKKEEIMTEKEKRDKGELYNLANDEELVLEMKKCKQLCYGYNHISPDKMGERKEFMKKILGSTGDNLQIESNFYCDYGYNTHVGENFYVNHNCVILDVAKVEFGDNWWKCCCITRCDHRGQCNNRCRKCGHKRYSIKYSSTWKSM